MHWALSFFLLLLPLRFFAQMPVSGAESEGMAGLGVAMPGAWSLHHNAALLPIKVKNQLQTSFRMQANLPEIASLAALAVFSMKPSHVLAGSLNRFGFGPLSQQQIRLGWGHQLGRFGLGLSTHLSQTAIEGFGSRRSVGLHAGTYASLFPGFYLAAAIANISLTHSQHRPDVPLRLRFGASWSLNDQLILSSELDKYQERTTRLRAGAAYRLRQYVAFRLGVATQPSQFSAGLGFYVRAFECAYASSYQQTLGLVHQLSLGIAFSE